MNRAARLVALVAGLALMLHTTPTWGQTPVCVSPGCNSTVSDANNNTAGGTGALHVVSGNLGNDNTAFGYAALLSNATGDRNTASGVNALRDNSSGYSNTASGINALANNTTGFTNTANGENALVSNTTGASNTASGANALFANITGNYNTASGFVALASNTTGNNNTASGTEALVYNTTGDDNTASGAAALFGNDTGNLNTATGFQALQSNSAGNNNTAVGAKALKKSLGTKNIGIGYQAGVTLQTGNNNIYIGNIGAGNESQTIRIGTAQAQTFIAGIGTTPVSGAIVMVDSGTGQLGIGPPSSARYKQDIETMGHRSTGVLQLRPVTFAYRGDAAGTAHYGLVAEEVAAVYPELVVRASTGEVQTVKYVELIPMLLNELQRQQHELTELRDLVGRLRGAGVVAER